LLEKESEDSDTYFIWKMIPPGKSHYFYSFGGENGEAEAARDQPHVKVVSVKHVRDIKFTEIDGETNGKIDFEVSFQMKGINFALGTQQKILDREYDPIKFNTIMPRLSDKKYVRPLNIRARTPWTFPISIFKDYQIDTEAKTNDCFEFDWGCIKLPKMTEEELALVKEELRKSYKTM
jgi:hypothetical protein